MFLGEPGYFDRDLARYRNATPESLQQAAAKWLRRDRRVALSVVPSGRIALGLSDSVPVVVS